MKIGILTFHFSDNFGALLQAYALKKWLDNQGHEVSFINYCPPHVEKGGSLQWSFSKSALKANLKIVYLKLSSLIHKIWGNSSQAGKFNKFRSEYLNVSSEKLTDYTELADATKKFHLLITGSDQIWSPSAQRGFDPAYFLNFSHPPQRCISYAASFGRDSLTPLESAELPGLMSQLASVSVRELSGVGIVENATNIKAACVPDPTLLHTGYDELISSAETPGNDAAIFCYALRTGKGIREVANIVSRELNAPILSPHNIHRRWKEIGTTIYPGPLEWIAQISKAKFVVTNSFHGVVFSIIFKKQFIAVGLPGSKISLNARSRNLLGQLDLMDRFLANEDAHRATELISKPINWDDVNIKQSALRNAGNSFLLQELNMTEQS